MAAPRLYFTLNQAQHRLRKYADRRCLAETGASSAQLGAMYYIRDHDCCSQADIAAAFGQDESAATGMLSRMEKGGFISRERDPDDRRISRVRLTDAGRATLESADEMLLDFNRRLGKGFSRDELALVQRFLDSVIRRVDARGL
jgi:DNA-binding MarR family transcriptional regulator